MRDWLVKIEQRSGCDIVLKWQVPPAFLRPERLYVHAQPAGKMDRVKDMPAIHPKFSLADAGPIRTNELVAFPCKTSSTRSSPSPGYRNPMPREIILGAGTADRRIFFILIEDGFDLALTPPSAAIHTPRNVGANVLPWPHDPVD